MFSLALSSGVGISDIIENAHQRRNNRLQDLSWLKLQAV